MRIIIILLTTCFVQASASSFAQKLTFKQKDATLKEVFNEIRKQTGYDIVWPLGTVRSTATLDADFNNSSLEEVLNRCFEGKPLEYSIENKTIVVREKQTSLFDRIRSSLAAIDIGGRVTDKDGEPLIGASVSLNGRQIAQTDQDGRFKLSGIEEGASLTVSYLGFQPRVVKAAKYLMVILERSESKLDEVQVMAYGTTSRRTNTGNIDKISGEEINNTPVTNPLLGLPGRSPGVIVTPTTGVPGAAVTIQIRGRTRVDTQYGANENPLFVIDGVPMAAGSENLNMLSSAISASGTGGLSPFSTISPGDIESIEILKDADATSIYGSRGASGVVLITTKKAKTGATTINARVRSGFSKANIPQMLNTQQYVAMRKEAFKNDNIAMTSANAYDLLEWDTTRTTNLAEQLLGGTASFTTAEASVSGGTPMAQYMVRSTYSRETNVYPKPMPNTRLTFSSNLSGKVLNDKLNYSFTGTYSNSENQTSGSDMSSYITLPPHFKLYNEDGSLAWNESGRMISGMDNPLTYMLETYKANTDNLTGNMLLGYKVMPGLTISSTFGYNSMKSREVRNSPKASQNPLKDAFNNSQFGNNVFKSYNIEPQATYDAVWGKSSLKLLAGGTIHGKTNDGYNFTMREYPSDALLGTLIGGSISSTNSRDSEYKYLAFFGRATYNYDNTYIVNISGRRDGSSRFGPNYRYSTFGAIGAAWIFSNLPVFEDSKILSFGKLRGSYGTAGNDQIGEYLYKSLYATALFTPVYADTMAISPTSFFKPDLHWEQTKKLEIATELGFLKDRIILSAAWYRNNSSDPLVQYPLPGFTGFNTVTANLNGVVVQNRGWELVLNTRNIQSKSLNWSTSFNITFPSNKLLKFPDLEQSSYASRYIIGEPLDITYIANYLGVDPATGLYTIEDYNNSGKYEPTNIGDLYPQFNTEPDYYGGMQNDLRYKNFSFNVFLSFNKQYKRNWMGMLKDSPVGSIYNVPVKALDRWQYEGHITDVQKFSTITPGSTLLYGQGRARSSDAAYNNICVVNLQSLNLAYLLPERITRTLGMKAASLSIAAQNVASFAPFSGEDPDALYLIGLRPLRTYVMGIQISL